MIVPNGGDTLHFKHKDNILTWGEGKQEEITKHFPCGAAGGGRGASE